MIRMQVAIVALLTGMVSGIGAAAAAFTCPGKSDVEGRITKYITAEYWTPAQRDLRKGFISQDRADRPPCAPTEFPTIYVRGGP